MSLVQNAAAEKELYSRQFMTHFRFNDEGICHVMQVDLTRQKVQRYLEGISQYLASYRRREGLTQNEMAKKLMISLNRYREYEQNKTDNARGIPLDLLLRISDLDSVSLSVFMARLNEEHESHLTSSLDSFEMRLLQEFRDVPTSERKKLVESFAFDDETDKLMPSQMRWFVRIFNQLSRLPYAQRMKIEREILEAYLAHSEWSEQSEDYLFHLNRLKSLLKYYFTNFEETSPER